MSRIVPRFEICRANASSSSAINQCKEKIEKFTESSSNDLKLSGAIRCDGKVKFSQDGKWVLFAAICHGNTKKAL